LLKKKRAIVFGLAVVLVAYIGFTNRDAAGPVLLGAFAIIASYTGLGG